MNSVPDTIEVCDCSSSICSDCNSNTWREEGRHADMTRVCDMPFDRRLALISRWDSTQEIAYQLAWAAMRGEIPYDYVCPGNAQLGGMRLGNVNRMVRSILEAGPHPREEGYVGKGRAFRSCWTTLTETDMVLVVRAMYRTEFIRNPDPEKEAWWDFVETVHETLDEHGRTSRGGLGFKPRDYTLEGVATSMLLNRIFEKANRLWDYGVVEEGDLIWTLTLKEESPEEVLKHATSLATGLAQAPALEHWSAEMLADLLWKTEDACNHCTELIFDQIDPCRLAAARAVVNSRRIRETDELWSSMLETEHAEARAQAPEAARMTDNELFHLVWKAKGGCEDCNSLLFADVDPVRLAAIRAQVDEYDANYWNDRADPYEQREMEGKYTDSA